MKFCSSWQTGSISDKTSRIVSENRVRSASEMSIPMKEPEAIEETEAVRPIPPPPDFFFPPKLSCEANFFDFFARLVEGSENVQGLG